MREIIYDIRETQCSAMRDERFREKYLHLKYYNSAVAESRSNEREECLARVQLTIFSMKISTWFVYF